MVSSLDSFVSNLKFRRDEYLFRRRIKRARDAQTPSEFTYYPEPTRPGDYNRGQRLLHGQYLLDQDFVEFDASASIWDIKSPNIQFVRRLHALDWMDDLGAVNTSLANKKLQQWSLDWIARYGKGERIDLWTDELVGWRVIRLISHALTIMSGLQSLSQERFFESLGTQINVLRESADDVDANPEGFVVLTAWLFGAVALEHYREDLPAIIERLDALCDQMIDGDTVYLETRRADHLATIFALLVWAKTAIDDASHTVGHSHEHAIQMVGASLRALRLPSRKLVDAQGSTTGNPEDIERALTTAQVQAVSHAPLVLGYSRVFANRLSLVMDCQAPNAQPPESTAHASTLGIWAYEGKEQMIGAMGSGANFGLQARVTAQETPAHSTLTIMRESSSELAMPPSSLGEGAIGAYIPEPAKVRDFYYKPSAENTEVSATHTGYLSRFGLLHQRRISVERDGLFFSGIDYLHPADEASRANVQRLIDKSGGQGLRFQVYFHMAPKIEPTLDLKGRAASFLGPESRILWIFRQQGAMIELGDSYYYNDHHLRPTPTKVMVLHSRLVEPSGYISWSFQANG